MLPAALVLALAGGIAAIVWPNPGPKSGPNPGQTAAPVTETAPMPQPILEPPVQAVAAPPAAERAEPDGSAEPAPTARNKALAPLPPVSAGSKPRLAIVLDDMGLDHAAARRAARLPAPVTLAFLPYATDLPAQTAHARDNGHELMVHMPMEPSSAAVNPGPNALRVGLDATEIKRRLDHNLGRFSGYVGFNNHMGSRFTEDAAGMTIVIREARARGLLFLDSRTTQKTVGASLAQSMGVPHAARDVFLDNRRDPAAIRAQLSELVAQAQKHGSAIAIGHPYPETLAVLEQWLPEARAAGYEIVPLSTLARGGTATVSNPVTATGGG